MTAYIPCAGSPVSVIASADTTRLNTGNYTAAFTASVLGTMPAIWEWFHATISTQTPGATFTPCPIDVRVDQLRPVTFTYPAGGTEWDPSQALPFRAGNELYFFFGLASTSTPVPVVTIWLRYDADNPLNRGYAA